MKTSETARISQPIYPIMFAIGASHLMNDTLQAVVPAIFPVLEAERGFTFTQLGFIFFALNLVSSILQPVIGYISDRKPMPYALPLGMTFSLLGMGLLSIAPNYWLIVTSVLLLGLGSAIFHPEGSRVSFLAAGSKRGLSQSIFQVGGNTGQALAPLISAFILVPLGQKGAAVFVLVALVGIVLLTIVSNWYQKQLLQEAKAKRKKVLLSSLGPLNKKQVRIAITFLLIIIFARSFYVTNMTSFYIFHLIEQYEVTIEKGQLFIFLFLALGAVGTFFGGPMADRLGRKNVIILSLLVPLPFSILLPYAPFWSVSILLIIIGFFLMLSFSVTVVYAQELVPSKIGTMAGLTVGLAFGMGALGAVVLGISMDYLGVYLTMILASFLPLLGLVGMLLPADQKMVADTQ